MTLVEHLRELRSRLIKSVVALLLGMVVAWYFREAIFDLLSKPLVAAMEQIAEEKGVDAKLNFGGAASPLMIMLKISLVAGLVLSCPVWLYQIWAFIVPGLHRHERKYTLLFLGSSAPLFVGGILLGYWVLPRGLEVLLSFTPPGSLFENILNIEEFLSFVLRVLVVFGVAFLIPVFVVLLNLVGVLTGERIGRWRSPIIFFIFVFAAVATPTVDPITMLLLAIPMCMLFLASEIIARMFDRRRRARLIAQGIDIDAIQNAGKVDD
ncbi:sec-independent protein translocase protein TatC [Thermasporomyces composti]|jgi:sec-independent protein translocase protein TatC|uniref:Sec-independent protein translocase protein TatC n=2 Tax=Thermasporomyces composti TaxID=696763 RepID=A0A3D9VGU2_THECX|nr:sec-independent protein translocase protein TatC [Thermasporomyces composti]